MPMSIAMMMMMILLKTHDITDFNRFMKLKFLLSCTVLEVLIDVHEQNISFLINRAITFSYETSAFCMLKNILHYHEMRTKYPNIK